MRDFIENTEIPGVFLIKRPVFSDARGFFKEIVRIGDLQKKLGRPFIPVQASHAHSQRDVLRGVHVAPWSKLIYVTGGSVQQVVVDLRPDSPTFKKHLSLVFGGEERVSIFIPPNCGNAYLVLSAGVDYIYLVDDYWQEGKEKTVIWNDPTLNIPWQIKNPIVSAKDASAPNLAEFFPEKLK